MTVHEIITLADELAPNVFSDAVKIFEINRLEARIRVDILGEDPADVTPFDESVLAADTTSLSIGSGRIDDPDPGGDDNGGGWEITDPTNPPSTGEGDDPTPGWDSGGGTEDPDPTGGDDSGGTEDPEPTGGDDSGGTDGEEPEPIPGTLALGERYRDVYLYWMISMYYYHMGEYEEYQNKKAMFEAAWIRFERDVCIALDRAGGS